MSKGVNEQIICLGHIADAHGIRGEVLLKSYTEPPENIAAYGPLWDEANNQFKIKDIKPAKKGLIARLENITSRDQAEALKGTKLYVSREILPEDKEDDSWYHVDLIGLKVYEKDQHIGEVIAVPNFGAGDLLEVKLKDSRQTLLIPFTKDYVPEVDIKAGSIHIVQPEEWDGEEQI